MRVHSEKLDRKALEIDFVASLGSRRYYIQSAFTMPDDVKREQENRPLRLFFMDKKRKSQLFMLN